MIRDTSAQDEVIDTRVGQIRKGLVLATTGLAFAAFSIWLIGDLVESVPSVDSAKLTMARAEVRDLVADIRVNGTVVASAKPSLSSTSMGVVRFNVIAGAAVADGETVAIVTNPELESRLLQEEVVLHEVEAEFEKAESDESTGSLLLEEELIQAEIDRNYARGEVSRLQLAYNQGSIAKITVLEAENRLDKAEATLKGVLRIREPKLKELSLATQIARQRVERQRLIVQEVKRQVDSLNIRSPVNGSVGQLLVENGARIGSGTPLLTIIDLENFEVDIEVPESNIASVSVGIPAEVRVGDADYLAMVDSVSPEVVAGQVGARLIFVDTQPSEIRQNQRVFVRLITDRQPNAVVIPRGEWLQAVGGDQIYVVDENVASLRRIRIGGSNLTEIQALAGIEPGEVVILEGYKHLKGASRVELR